MPRQFADLALPADERPQRGVRARRPRGPVSREARTGSARPLTAMLAERLEREAMREPPRGLLADRDRARSRSRLDPGGDVRRVAERDRLRAARADGADARPPGVDADPDVEVGDAPGLGDVARVAADHLEDAEGRARGALRVVLVRARDAEVGADAVALVRLDGAAVLLDRLAHLRHALADERLHLVRRQALAERRRADDVGEQHGDRAELVLAPGRLSAAAVRAAEQARRPRGERALVLAEDCGLELAQRVPGLQPQLVAQRPADGLVDLSASACRPDR